MENRAALEDAVKLLDDWTGATDRVEGGPGMSGFEISAPRPQGAPPGSPFHKWVSPDGATWTEFYRTETGHLLRFPNLADFEVFAASGAVICRPAPDVEQATLDHLYRNQVLPLVLSRTEKLVFHASAVETPAGAIAFVAQSGRGKSTLAASFATRGYGFLTDDGLVLERQGEDYRVMPSHPSIRLWEDSRSALLRPGAEPAPPLHFTSKARFMAGPGLTFRDAALPLRKAYFLGGGGASGISIRPLGAAETLIEWTRHSFLLDIGDRQLIASHFDRIAALANDLPCYRLDYPRRYEDLPRLLEAITAHAAAPEAAE